MKLSEIFNQLTYGELSQLNLGGADAGEINPDSYAKILSHVNLGLTALYKRFPLKEERLFLDIRAGLVVYPLTYAYAVSNPATNGLARHILDSVTVPFKDDILKIESVFTENNINVGLNDSNNVYGVTTPTAQSIRMPVVLIPPYKDIPTALVTDTLELLYRANHPIIKYVHDLDPTLVEVELPYSHLEPLLYFVASRVNNPIGMTNEFHAGNSYAAKYEQACALLERVNLQVDQGSQRSGFIRNGWV